MENKSFKAFVCTQSGMLTLEHLFCIIVPVMNVWDHFLSLLGYRRTEAHSCCRHACIWGPGRSSRNFEEMISDHYLVEDRLAGPAGYPAGLDRDVPGTEGYGFSLGVVVLDHRVAHPHLECLGMVYVECSGGAVWEEVGGGGKMTAFIQPPFPKKSICGR